jgi:hypothetical protein
MLEHLLAWWNYVLSGEGDVAPVTQRSATPGGA